VHGVCGTFGVLAVGIFGNGKYGAGWNLTAEGPGADAPGVIGILGSRPGTGMFSSAGVGQLASQLIGVAVLWTVILGVAFAFFKIQNAVTKGGIRSSEEDELAGLDIPEMGVQAYPEFSGGLGGLGSTHSVGSSRSSSVSTNV
jgi:Amt family ammonium transporter